MTEILRGAAIMTAAESAIGGASESPVQQMTQICCRYVVRVLLMLMLQKRESGREAICWR
jgi:acyl-coenzyme A thioesterase PaaI-like protein